MKQLNLKNINNQEIKYEDRWYVGQVINGLKEGKGVYYYNSGDRYERDFKNGMSKGKGIIYYKNGDREMGDFYDDIPKWKFVMLTYHGEIKINNY